MTLDKHGMTPIMIASRFGYVHVVDTLLDYATLDQLGATNKYGMSAYDIASQWHHTEVLERLHVAGLSTASRAPHDKDCHVIEHIPMFRHPTSYGEYWQVSAIT